MPINAKAKLIDKEGLTTSIVKYHFEMIDPVEMNFFPGQYIILTVDGKETRNYSIATSPLKSNKKFQIIVDLSPQGKGSQYLEMLEINAEISFIGEVGEFCLPDTLMPNLVFVGTNTGMAALKSIIESVIANKEDYDVDMYVYCGGKNTDQILLPDLFKQYFREKHLDDYHIYIDEEEVTMEDADKGKVSRFIERLDQEKLQNSQFFLCGSGEMIDEVTDLLKQKGISTDVIIYEKHY